MGKSAFVVCIEVGFEQVMLEFRIGINECSFGSRIAAARCHVANLGRASRFAKARPVACANKVTDPYRLLWRTKTLADPSSDTLCGGVRFCRYL